MAKYKLYCIGASGNSYKVALYLNCAGLDWERHVVIDMVEGLDLAELQRLSGVPLSAA